MIFSKSQETEVKSVKYRTIRLREEVAVQLDEWRDLFDDASLSEVMWRVFALARRELKRVRDKKRKAREKYEETQQSGHQPVDLFGGDGVE